MFTLFDPDFDPDSDADRDPLIGASSSSLEVYFSQKETMLKEITVA